jgi:DNA-binding SARP family transcriptional activator
VEFRLLGRLEVEANGVDLTPARKQHRALIVLLLLHQGEVVATDDLVEALWGDRPPETAHKAIHGHISALRKLLGAERIETRPPGYLLRLAEGDELDICRVESIAGAAPGDDGPARSEKLREALALFRGEPLAEFRYEAFASEEAARLEALRLAVLEEQIESELRQGRHEDVVPELERLIAANPFREDLRAHLMLALYRTGRQADALRAYQEARSVLVDELGIDPSAALQRLERQILNHDPGLAAPDTFTPARHRSASSRSCSPKSRPRRSSRRERSSGSTVASWWTRRVIPFSLRSLALAMRWPPPSGSSGRLGTSVASGSASTRRRPSR